MAKKTKKAKKAKKVTKATTFVCKGRCGKEKPLTEFYAKKNAARAHDCVCKECKEGRRLQRIYGVTLEAYRAMDEEQGGVCAICKRPETVKNARTGLVWKLAVDHNHETGAVRGLLCSKCNSLLGDAEDSIERLQAAIDYLRKYGET